MAAIEVRSCTAEELRGAVTPITHFFGRAMDDETFDRFKRNLPPERMHAAFDDGGAVAGAGAFPFEVTVPGGRVRAGGVTLVGVLPTHRRRGLLTQLMRAQLDALHERGEPVAYLWASEGAIYPRFGYGIASLAGNIEIARTRAAFALPFEPSGRRGSSRTRRRSSCCQRSTNASPPRRPGCSDAPATGGPHASSATRSRAVRAPASSSASCWRWTGASTRTRSTA